MSERLTLIFELGLKDSDSLNFPLEKATVFFEIGLSSSSHFFLPPFNSLKFSYP